MSFFKNITRRCEGIDSSRQLALGLSLGAMVGVLPKDNLLCVGLLVILIVSGSNFIAGTLAGVSFSLLDSTFQPLMNRLGEYVLNADWVVGPLSQFLQLPYAAWTRLDNTLVAGSFTTCLISFVPVYLASFYLIEKNRNFIRDRIFGSPLVRWIVGYENVEDRDE